jgi:uncharacterized membrane-anchored protein
MRNLTAQTRAALAAFVLLFAAPAFADGPDSAGPDVAAAPVRAAPLPPSPPPAQTEALTGQSGQISLVGGEVSLNVPAGYRFYSAEAALAYLQRNNAAAPSGTVLGLLAPANARVDQPGTWATVVSYDAIGYVAGESASGLGEASLEDEVRAARASQGRVFEGFAIQPAFDSAAAGLGWAERTGAPGAASGGDFRHEQRLLARLGVAGLTSLGSADQMGAISAALPDMIGMLAFPTGQTYADFQPANDTVSNYTVPALVVGAPPAQTLVENAAAGGQQQTGVGGLSGMFPWIALGVVGLAGAGYLMMRRRRDPNLDPEDDEA